MTPKTNTPKANVHNSTDFKSIYVNFAQTAAGPTDISIGVGEALPTETGIPDIEIKARLVMAPLQAKIMLALIYQVVQQYEQQFGKIVVPPVIASQMMPELANPHSEKSA